MQSINIKNSIMFKKVTYFIFSFLLIFTISCSNDDKVDDAGGSNTGIGNWGDPHFMEIKILEGEDEGFLYQNEFKNNDGQAYYVFLEDVQHINFLVGDEEESGIMGQFIKTSEGFDLLGDISWQISISEIEKYFIGEDISITVSEIDFLEIDPQFETGMAAFKLSFHGKFVNYYDPDDIYTLEGTVIVNYVD